MNVPSRPVPFQTASNEELETKKRVAQAPKRKSHVRAAAIAGDVQTVLAFLETIQDPAEATELTLDAHKYLTRHRHVDALRLLVSVCRKCACACECERAVRYG